MFSRDLFFFIFFPFATPSNCHPTLLAPFRYASVVGFTDEIFVFHTVLKGSFCIQCCTCEFLIMYNQLAIIHTLCNNTRKNRLCTDGGNNIKSVRFRITRLPTRYACGLPASTESKCSFLDLWCYLQKFVYTPHAW